MNITTYLAELIAIDSPTGFTSKAIDYIENVLTRMDYEPSRTGKGALRCALGGNPRCMVAGHVDTLGAIISGVNSNGTLRFSLIGGVLLPSFEGGFVRVHTMGGKIIHGTLLLNDPSAHSNKKASSAERTPEGMFIRLDEVVSSAADVEALGIRTGDIVAFEPKYMELPSGYIKSHFLDNKAGCAVLLEIARRYSETRNSAPVELFFSTYEEVGHGGAPSLPSTVSHMLVIDMGVVGDGLAGNELRCSICAKDSGGPYDYDFRTELVRLAEAGGIPHALDVYPYYSSDGTAAWRAGADVRVALIGPGVHASHGMERTHKQGLEATVDLCLAYFNTIK